MKLFISYSRDDKAWVYELWRHLRDELHHDAWIDRRIVPADDWWHTILENIEMAETFIYVMSPKSVESIYCRAELQYALDLNKPILPIMLKRCDFPEELRRKRVQYETLTDEMNMDKVMISIMKGLMNISHREYPPNAVPRPDVPTPKQNPEHIFEVFALAEEAAAEDNITLAQQFFAQVIEADPDGLGMAAKERLDEIMMERDRATAYANVKRLADNPVTVKGARAAFRAFQRTYGDYDPDNLTEILNSRDKPKRPAQKPQTPVTVGIQHVVSSADKTPKPATPPTAAELTRRTLEILPPPFEWIHIPAGQVTLEGRKDSYIPEGQIQTFDVPEFLIAKYPVTNAQFAKFIDAGGYNNQKWWTDEGWQYRQDENWTEPRYWQEGKWNGADYPVVGVSWFEAVAFCQWFTSAVGTFHETSSAITLPTEQQWQRAAQGDDGRTYPYGNDFDKDRCNTLESGIKQTTPVTRYQGKGDSPFGVVDMSGNVLEWCVTDYNAGNISINEHADTRALRGGSYINNLQNARAASRNWFNPDFGFIGLGFRVVWVVGSLLVNSEL